MVFFRSTRAMLALAIPALQVGCGGGHANQPQPKPAAVVFEDRLVVSDTDDKSPLGIPLAQLPAPGQCRLWNVGRPLREQSPAGSCAQIEPSAPPESRILYRPPQDPRLVHVRIVDPDQTGLVTQVRVYDAERGTYLGTKQRARAAPSPK
jgi:hypothetical protein